MATGTLEREVTGVHYVLTPAANQDLLEIWQRIAEDSIDLADRIENELHERFAMLAKMPRMGHRRPESKHRNFRFFPVYSFVVAYQPDEVPLVIVGVLRGKRNFKKALKGRSLR